MKILLCCFFGVLALIVAPGTLAAEPDSDLAPIRGLRRLTQTSVEYLQRAKLTADDGAAGDLFGNGVSTPAREKERGIALRSNIAWHVRTSDKFRRMEMSSRSARSIAPCSWAPFGAAHSHHVHSLD